MVNENGFVANLMEMMLMGAAVPLMVVIERGRCMDADLNEAHTTNVLVARLLINCRPPVIRVKFAANNV